MGSLLQSQAENDQEALRFAIAKEAASESRISELETELTNQRNAMRDAVSWAKANTKQRLRSAQSRHKDLQLQLDEHREAESKLAQQENELRELLELAKCQHEQDLQACEAQNIDLQAQLSQQQSSLLAYEEKGAELEDLLSKQRDATAVEAKATEEVSELAAELAKQKDETEKAHEARVKKLKARIRDLELMLDISKDVFKGDSTKTVETDTEVSIMCMNNTPSNLPEDRVVGNRLGRSMQKLPFCRMGGLMASSRSAGSLHSGTEGSASSALVKEHAYVLKNVGFSWPGRHLGPDQEGPLKMKFNESEEGDIPE